MYLQALLRQALRTLGHAAEAEHSIHFSYEMVALSHATARELGYELLGARIRRSRSSRCRAARGSASRPTTCSTCWSGRRRRKSPGAIPSSTPADAERTGRADRGRRDPLLHAEVLARQADRVRHRGGAQFRRRNRPYLQYAVVRANNIFAKLQEREGLTEAGVLAALGDAVAGSVERHGRRSRPLGAGVRGVAARRGRRAGGPVARVLGAGEVRVRAGAAVQRVLPSLPILNEERPTCARWRAAGVAYFRAQLTRALDLMGIEVPARM